MFDRFNENAESYWVSGDNTRHVLPSAGVYSWPLQHEDDSRLEKMWSGPEPQACGLAAQTSGNLDRNLVEGPVAQTTVGMATLKGCYNAYQNSRPGTADALARAISTGSMTNKVELDCYIIPCVGYKCSKIGVMLH